MIKQLWRISFFWGDEASPSGCFSLDLLATYGKILYINKKNPNLQSTLRISQLSSTTPKASSQ
jgi:hypothetical protein